MASTSTTHGHAQQLERSRVLGQWREVAQLLRRSVRRPTSLSFGGGAIAGSEPDSVGIDQPVVCDVFQVLPLIFHPRCHRPDVARCEADYMLACEKEGYGLPVKSPANRTDTALSVDEEAALCRLGRALPAERRTTVPVACGSDAWAALTSATSGVGLRCVHGAALFCCIS